MKIDVNAILNKKSCIDKAFKKGKARPWLPYEEMNNEIKNEPVKIKKLKAVKLSSNDIIKSINLKTVERRKAGKNQVTVYLLDDELQMLDKLHFEIRKEKIKTNRSFIVGEAVKMYYTNLMK